MKKDWMQEWIIHTWNNIKRYRGVDTLRGASLYGVSAGRLIHEMSQSTHRAKQVSDIIFDCLGEGDAELFRSWYGNLVSPGTSNIDNTPSDHLLTMKKYRDLSE
jgi:hypothetical protein